MADEAFSFSQQIGDVNGTAMGIEYAQHEIIFQKERQHVEGGLYDLALGCLSRTGVERPELPHGTQARGVGKGGQQSKALVIGHIQKFGNKEKIQGKRSISQQ